MEILLEERVSRFDVLKKWLPRIAVSLLFVFVGANKFREHSMWIQIFSQIGFGQWFRYFTGVLQVAGGLLVLVPRTFPIGITILGCTMVGAMASWVFLLSNPISALFPAILLGGLVVTGGEELLDFISRIRERLAGRQIRPAR